MKNLMVGLLALCFIGGIVAPAFSIDPKQQAELIKKQRQEQQEKTMKVIQNIKKYGIPKGTATTTTTTIPVPTIPTSLPANPEILAVDGNDNIFVLDKLNSYYVWKLKNSNGVLEIVAVFGGQGQENGKFKHAIDLAIDNNNNVYIADYIKGNIQKFDNNGNFDSEVCKIDQAQICHIGIDDQYLYVTTFSNDSGMKLKVFTVAGVFVQEKQLVPNIQKVNRGFKTGEVFLSQYMGLGQLLKYSVALNAIEPMVNIENGYNCLDKKNNLFVLNSTEKEIKKYNASEILIGLYGENELEDPLNIAVDGLNNVYVIDNKSIKILKEPTTIGGWMMLGNGALGQIGNGGCTPSLLIAQGIPYVAQNGGDKDIWLTVKKFNGANWEVVGENTLTDKMVFDTRMVVENNNIYLAFIAAGNANKIKVLKLVGNSFISLGEVGPTAGSNFQNQSFDLFVSKDVPYVAFVDANNGSKASVARFNGASWEAVGNYAFSQDKINSIALGVTSTGMVYVVFEAVNQAVPNQANLTAMKYVDKWETAGQSVISPSNFVYKYMFSFDNDTPYLTHYDQSQGGIVLKKFNGAAWEQIGDKIVNANVNHKLVVVNNCPYFIYDINGLRAKKYVNSKWVNLGNKVDGQANMAFAMAVSQDVPYISFINGFKLYVSKFILE